MKYIFYPKVPSDDSPPPGTQSLIYEEQLQRKLICFECGKERADTWYRTLQPKDGYTEFVLCSGCRAKFLVDKPEGYGHIIVFGTEYEEMPI